MTKLENLKQEKENLEYAIKNLQEHLDQVNSLIEKEIIEIQSKRKRPKKVMLTPTQEKVMKSLQRAIPYYRDLTTKRITAYGTVLYNSISSDVYIDGKNIVTEWNEENKRFERISHSYIMGANRYAHEMDTKTLKALEKKGYIKIIEIGGNTMDLIELVDNIQQPEIYTELTKINISYTYYSDFCKKDLTQNTTVYCPIGQENKTFNEFKNRLKQDNIESIEITSTEVVPVDTWKF